MPRHIRARKFTLQGATTPDPSDHVDRALCGALSVESGDLDFDGESASTTAKTLKLDVCVKCLAEEARDPALRRST